MNLKISKPTQMIKYFFVVFVLLFSTAINVHGQQAWKVTITKPSVTYKIQSAMKVGITCKGPVLNNLICKFKITNYQVDEVTKKASFVMTLESVTYQLGNDFFYSFRKDENSGLQDKSIPCNQLNLSGLAFNKNFSISVIGSGAFSSINLTTGATTKIWGISKEKADAIISDPSGKQFSLSPQGMMGVEWVNLSEFCGQLSKINSENVENEKESKNVKQPVANNIKKTTNNNSNNNDGFWDNDPLEKKNSPKTQQQEPQQPDYSKKQYENTQQNLKSIQANSENLNKQATNFSNAVASSYYTSKKSTNAANNMYQNSSLDEKYSSIEELEQAYQIKLSAINQNAKEYKQAKESGLNNGYNYYMNNAQSPTEKSVGTLVYGIGSLANNADAAKREREAKEQLERERQSQIKRIEQEKRAQILAFRKDIFTYFKDGGVPMYSENLSTNEVYLFAYTFDKSNIENDNMSVHVSNVFPLAQYKDGTWPYKNELIKQLNEKVAGNVTLIGYYTSKVEAEKIRNSFITVVPKSNIMITDFQFIGTTAGQNGSNGKNNATFWDSEQPANIKNKDASPQKEQQKSGTTFWD
jgi:hypothetical protein